MSRVRVMLIHREEEESPLAELGALSTLQSPRLPTPAYQSLSGLKNLKSRLSLKG